MNTKNNKRRRASIDIIERVLMELLQTRELDQISVSDLCKRAGLNRGTFYANYDDIYALADTLRKKLEAEVSQLYADEKAEGYNSNDFLKLFQHIASNQLFYKTYFKLGYHRDVQNLGYDYTLAEEHFHGHLLEYHMEFFRSGLNRIIQLWLERGCQETPEEMFEVIKSEYCGRMEFFASGN